MMEIALEGYDGFTQAVELPELASDCLQNVEVTETCRQDVRISPPVLDPNAIF